jgi:hypothetical protein
MVKLIFSEQEKGTHLLVPSVAVHFASNLLALGVDPRL